MAKIISQKDKNFNKFFHMLLLKREGIDEKIDILVKKIIFEVRKNSDKSLIKFTSKFDKFAVKKFQELVVKKEEIERAFYDTPKKTVFALKEAVKRITSFHKKQLPKDLFYKDKQGVNLGCKWSQIDSVGLYVPGGLASYPSSVIMNAVPAVVAKVNRIVMVCPAPRGFINPTVLCVAKILNIKEVYKIGGAQAIAALAYGTQSIKKVDKIFGPGNAYVASAKKQVFGKVGIDMIAGPSEVLVVADRFNNPNHIAIDLLSQAEHDEQAQAILITDCHDFAREVLENIEMELKTLTRGDIAEKSWNNYGAIIVVDDIYESYDLINEIAPEHLEVSVKKSSNLIRKILNAGALFIGKFTPEAIGDYVAGPNHVLPTDRTAKFSSGLNVLDFMKRTTVVKCDKNSLKKIGPSARILADEEGLQAHSLSISKRID